MMTRKKISSICTNVLRVSALSVFFTLSIHAADDPAAAYKGRTAGDDWPGFNGTYGEQHFSGLSKINQDNIKNLGLAWYLDLEPGNPVTGPIEVDGVVYFASGYSVVHAVDVATGKLLWKHDPHVAEADPVRFRQGWGSRGVAWWNGKLYVGTIDGRLIAIDAKTGKEVWSVNTLSEVKTQGQYISGAPRIFDGKVIIGNGGAEHTTARGFVTTYEAETGKQLWRFYTVPGNPDDGFENDAMKMAAKTWYGDWWTKGGGGTVWNTMTYDEELDMVYLGVGNGSPWNRKIRSEGKGDNLFLCSVVALDAKTGEYRWHYQINPGESWDYNASMDMQLGEVEVEGNNHKVLVTAPKNGFFYVIDRESGKLLSAENFTKVTWAKKIDIETGRPLENPGMRYPDGGPITLYPSPAGAHSWLPMSFDDEKDRVFIPVIELGAVYTDKGIDLKNWKHRPGNATDYGVKVDIISGKSMGESSSKLIAWDVAEQKELWHVPTPGTWNGGVLATDGNIVFQGEITGEFKAYNADSGELIWSYQTHNPVLAPPITYMDGGKQYVTVLTGIGTSVSAFGPTLGTLTDYHTQQRRVLTFVLDGDAELPAAPKKTQLTAFADPDYKEMNEATFEKAYEMYDARCVYCHGVTAISGGHAPDLRASAIVGAGQQAFNAFLKSGNPSRGMPSYQEVPEDEMKLIRDYIRAMAANLRNEKD